MRACPPVRVVSRSQVVAILDKVRTGVLEWALKLESEGITGDGISFTETEKQIAKKSTHITIQNFQGVIGDVTHSTVTQNLDLTVKTGEIKSLIDYLKAQGVGKEDLSELQTAIADDPSPTSRENFGPKVSSWMGNMVGKAASGTWKIGMGVATGLLSNAIATYYGF